MKSLSPLSPSVVTETGWLGMPLWLWAAICVLIMFALFQGYYWFGHFVGEKLYASKLGTRIGRQRIQTIENLVRKRGALAVFGCFWVPVLRHTLPSVAGVLRISYPWYVVASAFGALLWTPPWIIGAGVFWGWLLDLTRSPLAAGLIMAVVVAGLLGFFGWRRRRRRRSAAALAETETSPTPEPARDSG
ncbi:DedA family protein [Rhizohabitans arisaemae]|uniref:DedA family protein n=1 Tax=Rhizohabitans arisaemae TaxID=2720610 RepID=UPI0024B1525D|nr:VTT domain-containing protein [Rhizohabitans arisaemae]